MQLNQTTVGINVGANTNFLANNICENFCYFADRVISIFYAVNSENYEWAH